jgi:hypothetical protein
LIRTLLEVLLGGLDELEGNELEAAFLEPGDDLADEVALNAVRLQTKARQSPSFIAMCVDLTLIMM